MTKLDSVVSQFQLTLLLSLLTIAYTMNSSKVLVVGATGMTGRHVVRQLLDAGKEVKVIARSRSRMLEAINKPSGDNSKLEITEASLLDLSDEQLTKELADVGAVVSCLGHNMDFKGIWGQPRKLVTDATRRLTTALSKKETSPPPKFVLMGSNGVANPAGTDDKRSFGERFLLTVIRYLVPPHADNEGAADYLYNKLGQNSGVEWSVIRPTDLIDADQASEYSLFDKCQGSLFGGIATRANVAKAMVDLVLDDKMWQKYKFAMPVLHDAKQDAKSEL